MRQQEPHPYWHDLCTPFSAQKFLQGAAGRPEGSRPQAVVLSGAGAAPARAEDLSGGDRDEER